MAPIDDAVRYAHGSPIGVEKFRENLVKGESGTTLCADESPSLLCCCFDQSFMLRVSDSFRVDLHVEAICRI